MWANLHQPGFNRVACSLATTPALLSQILMHLPPQGSLLAPYGSVNQRV